MSYLSYRSRKPPARATAPPTTTLVAWRSPTTWPPPSTGTGRWCWRWVRGDAGVVWDVSCGRAGAGEGLSAWLGALRDLGSRRDGTS